MVERDTINLKNLGEIKERGRKQIDAGIETKKKDFPRGNLIRKIDNPSQIIFSWKAREYEKMEKNKKWYLKGGFFLGLIIIGAFWLGFWLMGITFILIAIVGYIFTKRDPRLIEFKITKKAIEVDSKIYSFNDLKSFWIFYGLPQDSYVSIIRKKTYAPRIQLPIGETDPVKIRKVLLKFLPEKEQKEELSNIVERMIKF
jgi:hypothetical protein